MGTWQYRQQRLTWQEAVRRWGCKLANHLLHRLVCLLVFGTGSEHIWNGLHRKTMESTIHQSWNRKLAYKLKAPRNRTGQWDDFGEVAAVGIASRMTFAHPQLLQKKQFELPTLTFHLRTGLAQMFVLDVNCAIWNKLGILGWPSNSLLRRRRWDKMSSFHHDVLTLTV